MKSHLSSSVINYAFLWVRLGLRAWQLLNHHVRLILKFREVLVPGNYIAKQLFKCYFQVQFFDVSDIKLGKVPKIFIKQWLLPDHYGKYFKKRFHCCLCHLCLYLLYLFSRKFQSVEKFRTGKSQVHTAKYTLGILNVLFGSRSRLSSIRIALV